MKRALEHHQYLPCAFDDVCDLLETDGARLVSEATIAATNFAADAASYLETHLGFFDQDERVLAIAGALERSPRLASMPIEWRADQSKRLLPNVEAQLDVGPIISAGASATCELRLEGSYEPPPLRHRGVIEHMLVRRVADATLHTFLRHFAHDVTASLAT